MPEAILKVETNDGLDADTAAFYRHVVDSLNTSNVPFLVGGAYAFNCYTGIHRHTKDFDIFIRRQDYEAISAALARVGYQSELTYPHWLGKVHANGVFIDLIFSSGNGIAEVDDQWFAHAADAEVLGLQTKICPPEEMIWSKAFIMERERYDGADIAHLIHAVGEKMDWQRLLWRFGEHWRVLLSHLTLFGFVYPAERDRVPVWLMDELIGRLRDEVHAPPPDNAICGGTLLSREQYLNDIEQEGLEDGRVIPHGNMTPEETAIWTDAIPDKHEAD